MSFASLLGDLQALQSGREQELAKSLTADGVDDDKKVAAAALEGGATLPEGGDAVPPGDAGVPPGTPATPGAPGASEEEEGEFSKSFFDGNGNPVELFDATEMLKSLGARLEATESGASQALGVAVDLLKSQDAVLRTQGQMLKSLNTRLDQLAAQGRGRVATVSVNDRPAPTVLAKSEAPAGVSPQEFLAKALDAQVQGRLSGRDVSIAEGYLLKGMAVPADIVNRVFQS